MLLNDSETTQIYGGGNFGIIAGIGAAITFLISLVDGFLNPTKCS